MRNMKKIMTAVIALCLCLSFAGTFVGCSGTDEPKTTVTSEEWTAAFNLTNATASGYLTENGQQESVIFKIDDTVYYSENDGYSAFCVEKDGKYYLYAEGDKEGQEIDGFSISVGAVLRSFHLPEYEKFSYDEKSASYVSENPEYPEGLRKFNLYFNDGNQ